MKINNKNEHCLGLTLNFKTHVELLFVCLLLFFYLLQRNELFYLILFVCLFFFCGYSYQKGLHPL